MTSRLVTLITRDFRRAWPGILISVVCIGFLAYIADLSEIRESIQIADYRYFPWAIAVFLLSMVARSFAWRIILKEEATVRRVFVTLNEGYLFNNILPFRLGEIARAFLLSKTTNIPFLRVLPTIMIERIFDIMMVVGLLLITIPFLIGAEWALPTAATLGVLMVVGLIVLHLVARNSDWAVGRFVWLQGKIALLQKIKIAQVKTFFEGLDTLTDFRRFILVFFWMTISWVLVVVEYYLIALAFFPEAKFIWAAFGLGVVGLGVAIPSAPGSIGVVQASIVWVFTFFGANESVAIAYSIVVHAVYLVITSGIGVAGLYFDGESLLNVYEELRRRIGSKSD